jgi:hypothetical protein
MRYCPYAQQLEQNTNMTHRDTDWLRAVASTLIQSALITALLAALAGAGILVALLAAFLLALELALIALTLLFATSLFHMSLPGVGPVNFGAATTWQLLIITGMTAACALFGALCIRSSVTQIRLTFKPRRRPGSLPIVA